MKTALLLVGLAGSASTSPPGAAVIETPVLPAAGSQAAVLTVSRFGRYAVLATSASGTSLQMVDRMAGPGEVSGQAGERDGRLDRFFDRGGYKLVTRGPDRARGNVKLEVREFVERNAPRPPLLVELKPVEDTLQDFEQRSYGLQIAERRAVVFEAAGRSLADLRLWRDGTWLVDAVPASEVVQPRVGEPLLVCRLHVTLDPGLYLLAAYGGPPRPWAAGGDRHPLYLRFGIPRLAEAGRQRHAVSPFGIDRFLVPPSPNYFRIELPEARPATLRLGPFDPDSPFTEGAEVAAVEKQSVPPAAEIASGGPENGERIVTVVGEAGQSYVLQHFETREYYEFSRSGPFWISSVHSGHPEDSVDATGILIQSGQSGRVSPLEAALVELDPTHRYERRFNLLEPLTLFVHLKLGGTYEVVTEGVEARHRVEPFLVYQPEHYKAPPWRGSGWGWELESGYHVLTIEPTLRGIVTLTVRPKGLLAAAAGAVGLDGVSARTASVRFPGVTLDTAHRYTLYLNRQPGVQAGLVLRPLPLDLRDALPLTLGPGDRVTVPFAGAEAGTLRADAEDGSALEVSIDGGAWQATARYEPGEHTASLRGGGTSVRHVALVAQPRRFAAAEPLPPMPEGALEALPQFPVLEAGVPRPFDLDRTATATLLVKATEPGLYHLESTGLLATQGNLRSRTVTSFAREAENGVGRNFQLRQYLREGDYQLTVGTRGQTRGHLGVTLERTAIAEGGFLTSRIPARASLRAGDALAYRFVVTKPGRFRVRALGLGRRFHCRLEDQDGWPLVTPGGEADVTYDFGPGRYRFLVLPEPTEARVVAVIEPMSPPSHYSGHGPHRLSLQRSVSHVWLEPPAGATRVPDTWELTLPATAEVSVELTGEMQGEIERLADDGAATTVASVPVGGWKGTLEAGRHRLEVVSSRPNNAAPYTVGVWPKPLLAGLERAVSAPGEIELTVGQDGLLEIGSFGDADVKARLYDAAGRLVAADDDRPDDWNFALSTALTAGHYRLVVAPVGAPTAATTVWMRTPREQVKPALALPAAAEVALGRDALVYPLTLPAAGAVLRAEASSAETVGIGVEAQTDGVWRTLGSDSGHAAKVAIALGPRAGGPPLRLRAWSLDRRGSHVRLRVTTVSPEHFSEKDLTRGITLPKDGAAELRLDRPGLLRLEGEAAGLRWCAAGEACRENPTGVVAARDERIWLVADGARPVRAARVALGEGVAGSVVVALDAGLPALVDLAPGRGPAVVLASAAVAPPGVLVAERDRKLTRTGRALAAGARSALSASLAAERAVALVWTESGAELRLVHRRFAPVKEEEVPRNPCDGAVAPGKARAFDLGRGPKRIDLALGAALAAVLSKGDEVTSVHWGDGDTLAETAETAADRLTLLNLGVDEARFSFTRVALERTRPPLAPGAAFEEARPEAGTLRLEVAPRAGATVHVRGARGEPVLVSSDGHIDRGNDLAAPSAGGTLLVPHGPGRLLVWLDVPGAEADGLWPGGLSLRPVAVDPPASLPLSGPAQLFHVELKKPALVHLRSATPGVTLVRRESGTPEMSLHADATRLDVWLPAGRAEIGMRAFAGATLSGTAELTATDVTPIGEGLGPEVLLAPGATRLFSFEVPRPGPVGVGVRADADVVETRLLSREGRLLGEGTVQMPVLEAGTYLVALHVPAEAKPVVARPAVAGLKAPDTGPPEDVVQKYLEPEEPAPAFSARRVEADVAPEPGALAEEEGEPAESEPTEGDEEGEEPPPGGAL